LPAFVVAYTACYPLDTTWQGTVRQRQAGGGVPKAGRSIYRRL
jgi:hypothetical protein